jgi:hypothetical protein
MIGASCNKHLISFHPHTIMCRSGWRTLLLLYKITNSGRSIVLQSS